MVFAAARTEVSESREMGIKIVRMEGLMDVMVLIVD